MPRAKATHCLRRISQGEPRDPFAPAEFGMRRAILKFCVHLPAFVIEFTKMKLSLLSIVFAPFLVFGNSILAQSSPASFAYVLQADSLAKSRAGAVQKLAASGRDWIVLDANFSSDEPWTAADLAAIRAGRAGRKVIAYLSIGEAEDYRAYWQREWKTNPPAFLLGENPEWKGNYRVKYWQAAWQQIILADVDKIMAAGFDGVYLDIVDGFETFEQDGKNSIDDRLNPETKQSYRRDMVDWVKAVAARAPQNESCRARHSAERHATARARGFSRRSGRRRSRGPFQQWRQASESRRREIHSGFSFTAGRRAQAGSRC